MTLNPARIIEQSKKEAKISFKEICGPEIQRICDVFSKKTGLAISNVNFRLSDSMMIGEDLSTAVVARVDFSHNDL